MARETRSSMLAIPTTAMPNPILAQNPYRVSYSIQNLDAANYIAVSSSSKVTAGTLGVDEGQHIIAGQSVNDTDDKDEVWAIANTAAVNVAIIEVAEIPAPRPTRIMPSHQRRGSRYM